MPVYKVCFYRDMNLILPATGDHKQLGICSKKFVVYNLSCLTGSMESAVNLCECGYLLKQFHETLFPYLHSDSRH